MRKLLWVLLIATAAGQQTNTDIIPATSGLNLGHSNQRWNGFFQNLDILGTCTINGIPCGSNSGGGTFDPTSPGPIGGTTPGSGNFTTLTGTSITGPIGSGTPNTGIFTSVTTTGPGVGSVAISEPFGSTATQASGGCEAANAPTTVSGAASTDTGQSCLPLNSVIDSVVYRITTTITTTTSFTIGDATIAARFCGTQSTLTSGTTGVCFLQADQTGTSGPRQGSAAKVRVTFTGGSPGAGAIRLIVFFHTWGAPTS